MYVYDADGKQYLDWTSQAVCANMGHNVIPEVRAAINMQVRALQRADPSGPS